MASRHLQGYSPLLCQLRTDVLAPVSKYWMYRSHAGDMGPVSWSSCVTIGSKPLSLTPGLPHGRKNEATQDDGWASLSLVVKSSSRCRGIFRLRGRQWKVVTYGNCPQETYTGYVWTRVGSVRGMLFGFSLQGVHRFESPRLSDMSNCLFVAVIT
jgi:hypothetical protein